MSPDELSIEILRARAHVESWKRYPPLERDEIFDDALFAFARRSKLEIIKKPCNWILRAAKLIARDRRRRRRRSKEAAKHSDNLDRHRNGEPLDRTLKAKPVLSPWRTKLHAAVRRCVAELPAKQQPVVELCDMYGRTVTEAARECGVVRSTAKSRRARAHARLRPKLQPLLAEAKSGIADTGRSTCDLPHNRPS